MRPFLSLRGGNMAKKDKITWERGRYSRKRAEKVINTFNKARERALRSDKLTEYDKQYIPARVNLSTIAGATSIKDRDRILDYLQMAKGGVSVFKQKNLNDNVTMSAYQEAKITKQLRHINRQRKAARKELRAGDEKIPDYYKPESFDPASYKNQSDIIERMENLGKEAGTDYIALRRKRYIENYEKGLKHAYGEEVGAKIMEGIRANRTEKEIERILYKEELEEIDDHYVTAMVADERTKHISRIETAFNFNV